MSARKLGRFAGLVFVLVALVGGASSAAVGAQHVAVDRVAIQFFTDGSIEWN